MGESATKASGLYSTQDPIMYYNASEAGYPFRRNATLWEMCAGLVGQVRWLQLHKYSRQVHICNICCCCLAFVSPVIVTFAAATPEQHALKQQQQCC
jgi:hypothetical protein